MSRPRMLVAFCGAGGAATGYHRAGFDVVGIDIRPQPRFPFTFVEGEAIGYIRDHGVENVQEARRRLRFPMMLCGSMFGLRIQRHRYFEAPSLPLILLPDCQHRRDDYSFDHGGKQTERVYADAMGCEWMTCHEARQAIPPAFTQWIGKQLMQVLRATEEGGR